MFWWVTVPSPMFGSHMEGARSRSRVGSRYRYCLVSAATLPGAVRKGGMYESAARSVYPSTRRRRAVSDGAAGASVVAGAGRRVTVVTVVLGGGRHRPRGLRASHEPLPPRRTGTRARSH